MFKGVRQMPENKGVFFVESRNGGRNSSGELLEHLQQKEKHEWGSDGWKDQSFLEKVPVVLWLEQRVVSEECWGCRATKRGMVMKGELNTDVC